MALSTLLMWLHYEVANPYVIRAPLVQLKAWAWASAFARITQGKTLIQNPDGSAGHWEPNPAFQTLVSQCSCDTRAARSDPFSLGNRPATPLAAEVLARGWQDLCDRVSFFLGVGGTAPHPCDISKSAEMCCGTVCSTPCSATGVTAMV